MFWNRSHDSKIGLIETDLHKALWRIHLLEEAEQTRTRKENCAAGKHEWEIHSASREAIISNPQNCVARHEADALIGRPIDCDDAIIRCKHCHTPKPETVIRVPMPDYEPADVAFKPAKRKKRGQE